MEKYIKDGKVAVLYSPGYGAGWYSWNTTHKNAEELLFNKDIVQAVLDNNRELAKEIAQVINPDFYIGSSVYKLKIAWMEPGTQFTIDEYDGSESITGVEILTLTA